ncbi:MAG: UxaA family hydrolase, partial [Pseudomonadota bacterium]
MSLLALHPDDDVAVALTDQPNGVAAGHKVARRAVAEGDAVHKYGQVIGRAAVAIAPGDWVHSHNLIMSDDARRAEVGAGVRAVTPASPQATFQGYARVDGQGRVLGGVRNHVLVLTSVNCSATVARRIADGFPDDTLPDGLDGVVAFTHQGGCGGASMGGDVELLQRTLAGYARHPNVSGVLIVGLGCEANQIPDWLAREGLSAGPTLRTLTIQEAGGTARAIEQGRAIVAELVAE